MHIYRRLGEDGERWAPAGVAETGLPLRPSVPPPAGATLVPPPTLPSEPEVRQAVRSRE